MKATRDSANYRAAAEEGEPLCLQCDQFLPPKNCRTVEGEVEAKGTCDLFQPKADPGGAMDAMFGGAMPGPMPMNAEELENV